MRSLMGIVRHKLFKPAYFVRIECGSRADVNLFPAFRIEEVQGYGSGVTPF